MWLLTRKDSGQNHVEREVSIFVSAFEGIKPESPTYFVDQTTRQPPTDAPQGITTSEGFSADQLIAYIERNRGVLAGRGLLLRINPTSPLATPLVRVVPDVTLPAPTPRRNTPNVPFIIPPKDTPIPQSTGEKSPVRGSRTSNPDTTDMHSTPRSRKRSHNRGRKPNPRGGAASQSSSPFPSSSTSQSAFPASSTPPQTQDPSRLSPTSASASPQASPPRSGSSTPVNFEAIRREALGIIPKSKQLQSRSPSPSLSDFELPGDSNQPVSMAVYRKMHDYFMTITKRYGAFDRGMETAFEAFSEEFEVDARREGRHELSEADFEKLIARLNAEAAAREEIKAAGDLPLEVKCALEAVYNIRIRRCIEIIRNVLMQHTLAEAGLYAKKSGYHFKNFAGFYTLFKTIFITSKGKPPTYVLTGEDLVNLNKDLTDYFVLRIDEIRQRMVDCKVWTPAWNNVLTEEFLTWLLAADNELRERGTDAAHPDSKSDILDTLEKYIADVPNPADLISKLEAMRAVFPSAYDADSKVRAAQKVARAKAAKASADRKAAKAATRKKN
ncbi:hypothetical protein SCHPADRAFT_886632 [Schizopora paradoxa]|uniref:Uncharacterized protein n=1 Tax=Schizopora paradoxa TaxID=27342 RepID=A0A0H2S1C3_9AGAM|nr:hypothetical protein SCHPADRAFT_886632 [Schizopora paradoxa]